MCHVTESNICLGLTGGRKACRGRDAVRKFLRLGAAVAAVCVLSFGPFISMGQLSQARVTPLC